MKSRENNWNEHIKRMGPERFMKNSQQQLKKWKTNRTNLSHRKKDKKKKRRQFEKFIISKQTDLGSVENIQRQEPRDVNILLNEEGISQNLMSTKLQGLS